MDTIIENYSWLAVGLIMVTEYAIGASKLKSNSWIELAIDVVKLVFRIRK